MEVVEETPNMLVVKMDETIVRVPKDASKIPEKSILVGDKDITSDVVRLVKKHIKGKEGS